MEYETAGDPMSGLKWTHKTTEKIADKLNLGGIQITAMTVGKILKTLNYSLKSNVKNISNGGKQITAEAEKKRNSQFKYINKIREKYKSESLPAISCDTKKKEMIGNFKNTGTRYKSLADLVNDHDFLSYCIAKGMPYGIYDVIYNDGFVVLGESVRDKKTNSFLSADTPEFAVEAIEHWWLLKGIKQYSKKKLLILVDEGGSNGSRCHMWKIKIQEILCNVHGIEVTVCHYPPGASKWNPIEHRLFSEISKNWKGTPLIDIETALKYIRTAKTKTGLAVDAIHVEKQYQKGIKANKEMIENLNMKRHKINGSWNYTILPQENLLEKIS